MVPARSAEQRTIRCDPARRAQLARGSSRSRAVGRPSGTVTERERLGVSAASTRSCRRGSLTVAVFSYLPRISAVAAIAGYRSFHAGIAVTKLIRLISGARLQHPATIIVIGLKRRAHTYERGRVAPPGPSRFASVPSTIPRVSNSWPSPAPQEPEPLLERVRDLWTLRYIEVNCTAAIWRNDFGLELRVEHGGELIVSRLSRYGIWPLVLIAKHIKANLIAHGWFDPQNPTH